MIHADNFCRCNFSSFLDAHLYSKPTECVMTMMTFTSSNPSKCGIVKINKNDVVENFFEKQNNPPGNIANGAVYLMDLVVLNWIFENPDKTDISNDVIPNFVVLTYTWHNSEIHIDIGDPKSLKSVQTMLKSDTKIKNRLLAKSFQSHKIHQLIEEI